MQFYAVGIKDILPEDLVLFGKIAKVVEHMPDLVFDEKNTNFNPGENQLSCHLLCRALANYFEVVLHDGYFAGYIEHTWLTPHTGHSIIDPYPPAGASPYIVTSAEHGPWSSLYRRSGRFALKLQNEKFLENLEQTKKAVEDTILKLGITL